MNNQNEESEENKEKLELELMEEIWRRFEGNEEK